MMILPGRRSSQLFMAIDDQQEEEEDDRSEGLRKALLTVGEAATTSDINVGSTVVAGNNIPNLGIWQFQSYELQTIYDQGMNEETGAVEKLPRTRLEDPVQPSSSYYTRYVTLFSEKHHGGKNGMGPVVVSPNEVELSSMQTEVVDSVVMALPLFAFWTALAFSFANQYTARTGGTFVDALFGR
ncbi:expressed unknown protein [Seminavis robusta]|uniref:Uncharacterized protein n=1 Tax=Seminavis robusta TaxID=568900 RepID=A0A9N8DWY4_9STRA|nr:expressed unknown protein [Seminavis robusta]|eukprot:Sro429_g141180.1 n/a (184) ;mRNA; f:57234-57785